MKRFKIWQMIRRKRAKLAQIERILWLAPTEYILESLTGHEIIIRCCTTLYLDIE